MTLNRLACATFIAGIFMSSASLAEIVHDSEHYILKAQHGERWAAEDKEVDAKLAELREKNGGKPPNILYIHR